MEVHVKGLSELLAKLRSLPDKVAKNVARSTMREVAKDFTNEVRMKAPRGATGELQRAIKRRDSRGGPWYISQKIYVEKIKAKDLAGQKAAMAKGQKVKGRRRSHITRGRYARDAFYAYIVHWGAKPHQIPKGGKPKNKQYVFGGYGHPVRRLLHPGARKNPFMLRAWQQEKYKILRQIQIKLGRGIERVAGGN